jgi:ABC-type sugar transport system ATPase subunit
MANSEKQPILEMKKISKRFGAVQALSDVDFEVYLNEVIGLVGDNGAGKSTLVKIISGAYKADSGTYIFDGKEVSVNSPGDANALGIETVYQDLALCDNLDVVANLYLGREKASPDSSRCNWRAAYPHPLSEIPGSNSLWRPAPICGSGKGGNVEFEGRPLR